jgi:hypothetical protein
VATPAPYSSTGRAPRPHYAPDEFDKYIENHGLIPEFASA